MTEPDPSPPWTQPTAPQPAIGKRRFKPVHVAALVLLAVGVLCFGGIGAVIGIFNAHSAGTARVAAEQTADPRFATPTTTTEPAPTTIDPSAGPAPTGPAPGSFQAIPAPGGSTGTGNPTLGTVPGPPPTTAGIPPAPPPTTSTTAPAPRPTTSITTPAPPPATTPAVQQGVNPGAHCSPEGALGRTNDGRLMRCTSRDDDERLRWRKA